MNKKEAKQERQTPCIFVNAEEALSLSQGESCPECLKVIAEAKAKNRKVIIRTDTWDAIGIMGE